MTSGEFLTKATVWLAVLAYGWGTALLIRAHGFAKAPPVARIVWTIGCAWFVTHVVCAFHVYHHWSHTAAYEDTARQTQALTGWNSGFGLYVNYLFAAAWVLETAWWWLASQSLHRRPTWLVAVWHSFYAFMVLNGTIIFGHGPARWLGSLVFLSLAMNWWSSRSGKQKRPVSSAPY